MPKKVWEALIKTAIGDNAEYDRRVNLWKKFSGWIFSEDYSEDQKIEEIKKFIKYCQVAKIDIEGSPSEISFHIDSSDPLQITFSKDGKDTKVIMNDGEILSSIVKVGDDRTNAYYLMHGGTIESSDSNNNSEFKIVGKAYVNDCKEIEILYVLSELSDNMDPSRIDEIVSDFLNYNNLGFDKDEGRGTFYKIIQCSDPNRDALLRNDIVIRSPNENESRSSLFYSNRLYYKEFSLSSTMGTFDECISTARNFEKNCRYLYSLIKKAYENIKTEQNSNLLGYYGNNGDLPKFDFGGNDYQKS